jgi:hypothetical protein
MNRVELLLAVDELDDLIHHRGRPVPLSDRQVTVDRGRLTALAARLSAQDADLGPALEQRVRALQELVAAAKPVPLTDRVRLDKEAMYEALDEIRGGVAEERRSALAEPARRLVNAVDELSAAVLEGRLDRDRLMALAMQVSVPRSADLGPAADRAPDLHERVRDLQELVAAAKPGRFTDRVRVDKKAVLAICNAIRADVMGPDEP